MDISNIYNDGQEKDTLIRIRRLASLPKDNQIAAILAIEAAIERRPLSSAGLIAIRRKVDQILRDHEC